jgi:hypothetical protein
VSQRIAASGTKDQSFELLEIEEEIEKVVSALKARLK